MAHSGKGHVDVGQEEDTPEHHHNHHRKLRDETVAFISLLGARMQNEDVVQMFPEENLFCVHDGHGGDNAVKALAHFFSERAPHLHRQSIPATPPVKIIAALAGAYHEAVEQLRDHSSGAVSVCALCRDDAVYLAWIGDCVGAVFDTNGICNVEGCDTIDFAELFIELHRQPSTTMHPHNARAGTVRRITDHASRCLTVAAVTTPHSLMGAQPTVTTVDEEHASPSAEVRDVHLTVIPSEFDCMAAHREYMLACHQTERTDLPIQLSVLHVGTLCSIVTDMRFQHSIQPTRALGDCHVPHDTPHDVVVRHPSVMRVPLRKCAPTSVPRFVLLCSDGAFSGGAFPDMHAIVRFINRPLEFVRNAFYRRGHELTERLILAGHLTVPLTCSSTPLARAWHGIVSWVEAARFISHWHVPTVTEHIGLSTADSWVVACREAGNELLASAGVGATRVELLRRLARMAIVMGSTDNISLLIVPL